MARKKLLEKSVHQEDDGTWTAICPVSSGCGQEGTDIGYIFRLAPTKALAMDRLNDHFDEHVTGKPAQSIDDWRRKHKLVPAEGDRVTVEDLS
jgi:hypothetical protein